MKFFLEASQLSKEIIDEYSIEGVFGETNLDVDSYTISEDRILKSGDEVGKILSIQSSEDMDHAMKTEIDPKHSMLLIETGDWHIIPLENLIAKYAESRITLIATASTPKEIELLGSILELGVKGCLLKPSDAYSVRELLEYVSSDNRLELQELEVHSVEKMGNGDRVCVDTVSILKDGEGLLVGSTAAVQILVQAEVEESGFVNSRPFRVNAGVVASYVLNFAKTNYLSELAAGSSVMIVDREGRTRKEFVARVKIERRPMIVVRCSYNDKTYPVVLQDAETVKLVTNNGTIRVDKLSQGDLILGFVSDKARHFGMAIDEFLEEK